MNDAYLDGEHPSGMDGLGFENKIPVAMAISLKEAGHPVQARITPVSGFSSEGIGEWLRWHRAPGCSALSDGLACFRTVTRANCHNKAVVTGRKHPTALPRFSSINTLLGNLKTSSSGPFRALHLDKHARRCMAGYCFRFNLRISMAAMTERIATPDHHEHHQQLEFILGGMEDPEAPGACQAKQALLGRSTA